MKLSEKSSSPLNVGRKLMSLLDWTEYFIFFNDALIVCTHPVVQSGIQNVFLSKDFVKITRISSCTDWTQDNRACLECALMQITRNTLNCHFDRLKVFLDNSKTNGDFLVLIFWEGRTLKKGQVLA